MTLDSRRDWYGGGHGGTCQMVFIDRLSLVLVLVLVLHAAIWRLLHHAAARADMQGKDL